MHRIIKKIIVTFLIVAICSPTFAIATTSNINKHVWPYFEDEINAESAIVMDANSSIVLYEKNADKRMYPASLTKIMTAIIVLDKVKGNYDSLVTFSYNAVTRDIDKNSATIGASAGDQLTVKDCLYSLLLPSANDAANALAEHIAGSINDFVLLMNEKAKNLGLTNTHFVNPSGLHDDNQYTTASDMAKILNCAISYPIFLQISSSVSYKHAPIRKYKNPENSNNQVLNTNSIMVPGSQYYYNGVTSGKTGHTQLAGYNLACSAKKNDMHLICVTLKSSSEKQRFNDTKSLFDFHFKNYKSLSVLDFDYRFNKKIDTISINSVDLINTLSLTSSRESHITLPQSVDESEVKSKLAFQVKDIYNKYAIGYIEYTLDNKIVGSCTLEGKNANNDIIFTSQLNLSNPLTEKHDENENQNNAINIHSNNLLIKSKNGSYTISSTLKTLILIIINFTILILVFILLYTRVFTNSNFPINKIRFKIKRFSHSH